MRNMRARGLLMGVCCSLLLASAAPAAHIAAEAAPANEYRVQMVYRVGKSLKPFQITVRTVTGDSLGMWYATELVRKNGRWTTRQSVFGGSQHSGGTPFPFLYGVPHTSSLPQCPDQPACSNPDPFNRGAIRYTVQPSAGSRYYVASTHNVVEIEVESSEWRVKDVTDVRVRQVTAPQSSATGAGAMGRFVERFTSATAPGGRYGSEVLAIIPCEGEAGGTGSARLTGRGAEIGDGLPPHVLTCMPRGGYTYEYAFTRYQTQWRLEGDVTGIGIAPTRLFVFDYPKP